MNLKDTGIIADREGFAEDEQELEGTSEEEEEKEEEIDPEKFKVSVEHFDYPMQVIRDQWKSGDIFLPDFQRAYVWQPKQARGLIDSILLGHPIPPVFLFNDAESNQSIVVDGQQRIKAITSFFKGEFPIDPFEKSGRRKKKQTEKKITKFHLKLGEYKGKTFQELPEKIQRQFSKTALRATVISPAQPKYQKMCMYRIFTRLNTGSSVLNAQEIRNCVWRGDAFNQILKDLNKDKNWRNIFGSDEPDRRQRDVEMILRIFALLDDGRKKYTPSLKVFLDNALNENKKGDSDKVTSFKKDFKKCAKLINNTNKFGDKPCHFTADKEKQGARLNVQVLETLFCVLIDCKNSIPSDVGERYRNYRQDYWKDEIPSRGTDRPEVVKNRYNKLRESIIR